MLQKTYRLFNFYFYKGALPDLPVCLGRGNMNAIYIKGDDFINEILHEMAHLYNKINGIQDTSRQGRFHNKHFKEVAEEHGLMCIQDSYYNWITFPNKKALSFAKTNGLHFQSEKKEEKTSPQSYIRLYCPSCGTSIRAKKDVKVLCANPDCPNPQIFIPAGVDGRKNDK